ncbi:MAG: squalene/phytoene synthase family protein [Alphaproteobacteria bacterium]|nr:squalene/phytoene synthase family protein [Alphaproteobacteria bacterium]
MTGAAADPIAKTLRTLDRERYYATLILPETERAAVQALYAAVAEIAAVGERVREPMAGEIRLTWWAELLGGKRRDEAEQNPVALALIETMARHRLPAQPLINLIEARRFDLYGDPMPDVDRFEGYAGETVSVPLQLAATILNHGTPPADGDAAGHLGVALALFGHLRAFGFNAARGKLFLPLSLFAEHGVTHGDILGRKDSPALRAALASCRAFGAAHLAKARASLKSMPRAIRPAFAQIAVIDARARPVADPFAPTEPRADWLTLLRLMWFGATRT